MSPATALKRLSLALAMNPERDNENPADSVFCSRGAGVVVPWRKAAASMHLENRVRLGEKEKQTSAPVPACAARLATGSPEEDTQLAAIFKRIYGPVQRRELLLRSSKDEKNVAPSGPWQKTTEYLLVDGCNVIFNSTGRI